MSIHRITYVLFAFIVLLSACGSGSESAVPGSTSVPAIATRIPPTETQTPIPFTEATPASTQNPALFGAIGVNEIQAYALEQVAGEIFTRVMNGFIADDLILDYQIVRLTVFPAGSGGLLAEITYNVRTTDPAWLTDGGTSAADDWINDKCNRFDFVTTETEHQLKNRRLCN